MRKKVSGSIVVTLIVALLAALRTLGRGETVDSDESDETDESGTEKRGLKWGPIMPWWPR